MDSFKWGFSTIGCPGLSLSEAEKLGSAAGYPLVEVRITGADFPERELLKQLAADKRCFILGSPFRIASDDDDARALFKSCAELAAFCKVPYVRVFGGCEFSEPVSDAVADRVKRNLEFFDRLELPVQIALETHDGFASAKRTVQLFERIGRVLPVIWDSFHTWNVGKETVAESWALLEKYIIDVHVKDGNSEKLTLPGEGNYPLRELFALLKEKGYSGMVTCEHEKMWRGYLPELAEAFAALEPYRK